MICNKTNTQKVNQSLSLQLLTLTGASLGGLILAANLKSRAAGLVHLFKIIGLGAFGALLALHMIPQVFSHSLGFKIPALAFLSFAFAYALHPSQSEGSASHSHGVGFLLPLSLCLHSFADGLLLRSSMGFRAELGQGLIWAFVFHKLLESFWLYALLGKKAPWSLLSLFILAFPLGFFVQAQLTSSPVLGLALSAIALGFFAACYFKDYFWPLRLEIVRHPKTSAAFLVGFLTMGLFILGPLYF